MEVSCPSCGTKHETDNYPGAFEIPCVCGYSILVPELHSSIVGAVLGDSSGLTDEQRALPATFDAPDAAISLPDSPAEYVSAESLPGMAAMTQPSELPQEMPYDPFELPEPPTLQEGEERLVASGLGDAGQSVIDRAQAASLGEFFGPNYKVTILSHSEEELLGLSELIQKIISNRIWMGLELKRRGIQFEVFRVGVPVVLPEVLAVEVYIEAHRRGVDAKFEPVFEPVEEYL